MSDLRKKLAGVMPARRRQQLRYAAWGLIDVSDRVRGRQDPELPPKRLRDWIGGGDFRAIGEEMVGYARELADLSPSDHVLDVGSGIGRIAIPLTKVLDDQGYYEGIEIVDRGVRWCNRNISTAHPNFRFQKADIHNRSYNPNGKLHGESYRFPFPDATFDFAILTSVFTHLVPATTDNYIAELGRVLKPGGRVMGTWFLLNPASEAPLDAGKSVLTLRHRLGNARVENPNAPEDAIAFPENHVIEQFRNAGLHPREPISYGSWSGREGGLSFQDILVLDKTH